MPKSAVAAWTMHPGPASLCTVMTRLTIATWNINSVRLRIAQVLGFLDEHRPDVLCLQETKTADSTFPLHAFRDAGWPHAMIAGFKGRNGVAILSRHPFTTSNVLSWCGRDDGRHVQVTFPDGLRLDNIYVPSGGNVPDPEINEKFAHKLDFLEEVTGWIAGEQTPGARRYLSATSISRPWKTTCGRTRSFFAPFPTPRWKWSPWGVSTRPMTGPTLPDISCRHPRSSIPGGPTGAAGTGAAGTGPRTTMAGASITSG